MAQPARSPAFGLSIRGEFGLDFSATHLNHGSFGAAPHVVLQSQTRWRDRIERAAGPFFQWELAEELRKAARKLAGYLGAAGEDLVFVENATTGVMSVLNSLVLEPGDQILITNQTYPAVRNIVHHVAARSGVAVIEADLPFPVEQPEQIVDAFARALTEKTRLAIVDHVTSSTAVCMPLQRLVATCRAAGVRVLVDGAHSPGMMPIDLPRIDAHWYAGNAHKWLFAPRGCGFLWAHPSVQSELHPAVISHGLGRGFIAEFEWTGTRDPTAQLAVAAALDFREHHGEQRIVEYNKTLARSAAEELARRWRSRTGAPSGLCGSMSMIELPERFGGDANVANDLRRKMWQEARIDVPIISWRDRLWVRLSAQIYNTPADYGGIAEFIAEL